MSGSGGIFFTSPFLLCHACILAQVATGSGSTATSGQEFFLGGILHALLLLLPLSGRPLLGNVGHAAGACQALTRSLFHTS